MDRYTMMTQGYECLSNKITSKTINNTKQNIIKAVHRSGFQNERYKNWQTKTNIPRKFSYHFENTILLPYFEMQNYFKTIGFANYFLKT